MSFVNVVVAKYWYVLFVSVCFKINKVLVVWCSVDVRCMVDVDMIFYIVMENGNVGFNFF